MKNLLAAYLMMISSAHAHNNLFLPSDAYFSTAISQDFVSKLDGNQELSISYVRFSTSFMTCGYAGCRNARIEGISEATRKNLISTLGNSFEEASQKARTKWTNKGQVENFPLLIYNKDFNFKRFPVGLKFNENFKDEQTKKANRGHVIDDRPGSMMLRIFENWYAKKVRSLDTKSIPEDLTAFMGVEEPVVIDGSKIVFVVLLNGKSRNPLDHAERKSGLEMVIIGDVVTRIKNGE